MEPKAEQLIQWRNLSTGTSLSRETFGAVAINEAIAAADRFAGCANADSRGSDDYLEEWANEYTTLAKIYSWFRDKLGAQTMADVLDLFEQRKVEASVVRFFCLDCDLPCSLDLAIRRGYPEFSEELNDNCREYTRESLARVRQIIEAM